MTNASDYSTSDKWLWLTCSQREPTAVCLSLSQVFDCCGCWLCGTWLYGAAQGTAVIKFVPVESLHRTAEPTEELRCRCSWHCSQTSLLKCFLRFWMFPIKKENKMQVRYRFCLVLLKVYSFTRKCHQSIIQSSSVLFRDLVKLWLCLDLVLIKLLTSQ